MGILAQALNEDGLPGSGEIGYALPYYAFNHEDGVKYYIKNEDENRGLRSAYLVETSGHALQWKTMTAEEAAADDATANGKTATASWNIAKSATTQRWLILTAEEAEAFDNGNLDLAREDFEKMLPRIRTLAETPHQEEPDGVEQIMASDKDGVTPDIYDLSGRKVSGSLSPGVYIMAGKKVLVK